MEKEALLQKLRDKGFSEELINAFSEVPREKFVLKDIKEMAYEDTALPIGEGQTISQPYTIATMFSMLDIKKGQKILEVGSGSGYVLVLLSKLVGSKGKVFGIEKIKKLVDISKKNVKGKRNIKITYGDGYLGLKKEGKFDRIIVSAACTFIPVKLIKQLKENGLMVLPIGSRYEQSLVLLKKEKNQIVTKEKVPGFVFVPLTSEEESMRID